MKRLKPMRAISNSEMSASGRRRSSLFLGAPAMLLFLAATPCIAECHINPWKFFYGSEVPATIHAASGEACVMAFSMGRNSNMDSLAITEQPKHGAASWNGLIGYPAVSYTSSRGYRGRDEFVFAVSGKSRSREGAATVRVSVDVK